MEVDIYSLTVKKLEENDYRDIYRVNIDGKTRLDVYDGEPEDNSLARNFNDVYNIPDMLKYAFMAGMCAADDGQTFDHAFKIEYHKVDEL